MRSRLTSLLVAAGLVLAACGGDSGSGSTDAAAPQGSDTQAPASAGDASAVPDAELLGFQAETVEGDVLDVGQYAGSDLVVWFWAPW